MDNIKSIAQLLNDVKAKTPLVHHITNYVTVNDCANIVLALGGSPVMADDEEEVEEMVSIASTLVLNIGTLNARTIKSMISAGKKANLLGIPVVLDPVGVGATKLRTTTAKRILDDIQLAVLRGNSSEIKTIAGIESKTRGVDSTENFDEKNTEGFELAKNLAKRLHCTVAITGKRDIISDSVRTCYIENGHQVLSKVTGTGCMATSLIGCFTGVTKDSFLAASAGIITMGLVGEKAWSDVQKTTNGIGSFKVALFDWIYKLTSEDILREGKFYNA